MQVERAKSHNGAIAPTSLIRDRDLTPAQKLVWIAIRDREGKNGAAWPSLNTIASDTGLGRRTVIEAIRGKRVNRNNDVSHAGLIELGWLKAEETETSNRYECWVIVGGAKSALVRKAHQGGAKSAPDASAKSAPEPIQLEPTKEPTHSPVLNRFDDFWKSYPKKASKKTALKAWKRLKLSDRDVDKILTSLEAHKSSDQWVKDAGRFIPHPATWLNQERWDDELTVSSAGPRLKDKFDNLTVTKI